MAGLSAQAALSACSTPAVSRLERHTAERPAAAWRPRRMQLAVAAAMAPSQPTGPPEAAAPSSALPLGRRQLLSATAAATLAAAAARTGLAGGSWVAPPPAAALELAPLGKVERVGGDKLTGLTAEQVKDILARNLGEGMYFVTGDLTPEIFADDCVFKDPTNQTTGLSRYMKALGILFDASYSAVQLVGIRVTSPTTIEAEWRLGGYLKLPWHPRIEPVDGATKYYLNSQGLIELQDQTWSISAGKALAESFTPTSGVSTDIKSLLSA